MVDNKPDMTSTKIVHYTSACPLSDIDYSGEKLCCCLSSAVCSVYLLSGLSSIVRGLYLRLELFYFLLLFFYHRL